MTFDLASLRAAVAEGPVVRVVVAETRGSVPRERGASMIVRDDLVSGTIGGGALEFDAIATARACHSENRDRVEVIPLGPSLGQCCGGSVTLLFEVWNRSKLTDIGTYLARPLSTNDASITPALRRRVDRWDASDTRRPFCHDGWFVEPVSRPSRNVWVWGAGHVGRAIVDVLGPLPDVSLTWLDIADDRFPNTIPPQIETVLYKTPDHALASASRLTEHYVLTHSHPLDLEICHQVLTRDGAFLGLIGSETKARRFRNRLAALGHDAMTLKRLHCPIGDKALGKHPQAIAIGVAASILRGVPQLERLEAAE